MKPEDMQEAGYMEAGTKLPPYLPYPRFLLKMELTHTAKLLYSLLLDRATLSQKNGWQDGEGRTYIVYPIAEIADTLDKSPVTVKTALNELDAAGLLERKRTGFAAPNRLYVKVPPVVKISVPMEYGKPYPISTENHTYEVQETIPMRYGKLTPNNNTINNLTESQTMGVIEKQRATFGRYRNVFLSETEYDELKEEYPDRLERFIEEMSRYLAASGKSYSNYAAALRIWADNDRKGKQQGMPDYSYREGESL